MTVLSVEPGVMDYDTDIRLSNGLQIVTSDKGDFELSRSDGGRFVSSQLDGTHRVNYLEGSLD